MGSTESVDLTTSLANIEQKLNILIALLIRQLTPDQVIEWRENKEKRPIVELMLDLGTLNEDIANIVGMSYGSVANIKSARKQKNNRK